MIDWYNLCKTIFVLHKIITMSWTRASWVYYRIDGDSGGGGGKEEEEEGR